LGGAEILRGLAARYFDIANSDENSVNIGRHKAVNDLKGDRPIVLIDEIPWNEMNIDGELTLQCEDAFSREIEWSLRTALFRWKHLRGDMAVRPYYGVQKIIHTTGIGVQRKENEHDSHAEVVTFEDQFTSEADLEKLKCETITYDEQATRKQYEKTAELLGESLPVKICGESTGYGLGCKTWDDIVFFKSLDTLFYDLVDEPEFMHSLVGKLTDIFLNKIEQYNKLGLFDGDAYYNHCTSALTNDLHPNHEHTTSDGVWGRGLAQIFASVSPDMHKEFDTGYMIRAMAPFGLVYYGCCEPLHKKIDMLSEIPNLRKISITPWADVDEAADVMKNRYVMANKPNPSFLAESTLDENGVRGELTRTVNACKRNGCSCDIVLKDITTIAGKPENLIRWENIAMDIVRSY